MAYTIKNEIERKIVLKRKELTRVEIKKQLSRNGIGKYTSIETEMIVSKAFMTMNGTSKTVLMIFLLKRKLKFKKGQTPICINPNEICMTYKELTSVPFNLHPEQVRRSIKTLLERGFMKIVHRGGAYQKDKNIYGVSEKWRMWEPGRDFSPMKESVKRGYQGKGLGAIKTNSTHKNVSHPHTQKCESKNEI